jgi:vitamin B12 transporter
MSRQLVVLAAFAAAGAANVAPALAQAPITPYVLDGLVVTASPTPRALASVAQHVTILDGSELEARGLATVADALRDVSGTGVARSGSSGALTSVFLRGGESDYTLVLVDGVQVNQAGGGFDFESLSTRNVERIEIVRGPSSALYGSDAVAGVVHVITRMGGAGTRGAVRVEAGSYQKPAGRFVDGSRLSVDLDGGTDRAHYTLSLGRDAADGILAFNNRHENRSLSAAARFLPDDLTRVALTLRAHEREYHYPTDAAGAVVDRNAFYFEDAFVTHLSLARSLARGVEVEALLGLAETDGGTDDAPDDPADSETYRSLDHFRRATAQLLSHVAAGATVFTLGGEVEEESQRSFSESISSFGTFYGRSESGRANLAGLAHLAVERGPLAVSAGARLEDNERFGTAATWQAGASALLPWLPATRVRASAGRAIKEPTFAENFASGFAVGNPALDPERSLAWEVGVEQPLGPASLQATYFSQRFEDMIQYTFTPPVPGDPNYYNVAEARSRGIELEAVARVRGAQARASWTWLDTEVVDAGFDSGPGATFVDGERLLRRPRHTVSLGASVPVGGRGRVRSAWTVVGAREDRDFSTFPATPVELPRHALWSVGAEWALRPASAAGSGVSLTLRGENLLGERYEEALGFPAPRRQLYLGLTLGFGG